MFFMLPMVGRTWRQVFLLSAVEHWGDIGPEGTPDSMWMGDRTQTMWAAYSVPWIQNHLGWLGLGGTFYETTPERFSTLGSC